MRSHSSVGASSTGPSSITPALLTTVSRRPRPVDRLRHRGPGLLLVGDVGLDGQRPAAVGRDRLRERVEAVLAARDDRHRGTLGRQQAGRRLADAAARPCHQGHRPVESFSHPSDHRRPMSGFAAGVVRLSVDRGCQAVRAEGEQCRVARAPSARAGWRRETRADGRAGRGTAHLSSRPDGPLPRPPLEPVVLEGRTVRLEPLDADRHAAALFEAAQGDGADPLVWRYMWDGPFADAAEYAAWARRPPPAPTRSSTRS